MAKTEATERQAKSPMRTNKLLTYFLYLLWVATPGVFTLFLIHLVASYWSYYDIGINAAANSLGLLFFHMPIAGGFLYGTFFLALFIPRKGRRSPVHRTKVAFALMMCAFIILLSIEILFTLGYPNPFKRTLIGFVKEYIHFWIPFLTF